MAYTIEYRVAVEKAYTIAWNKQTVGSKGFNKQNLL